MAEEREWRDRISLAGEFRRNLFTVGTLQADGKRESKTVRSTQANQLVGNKTKTAWGQVLVW